MGMPKADLSTIVPPDELALLRQQGLSFRAIAARFNVRPDTLRAYARTVLPSHLYYISHHHTPHLRRCLRCSFLPEPRNPLLHDHKCLWCHVEEAGLTLLGYHESGLAHHVLDNLQQADILTASPTPADYIPPYLHYAQRLTESDLWPRRWNADRTRYRQGWITDACMFLFNRKCHGNWYRKLKKIAQIAEHIKPAP